MTKRRRPSKTFSKMPALAVVKKDLEAGLTNAQMEEKYNASRTAVTTFLTKNGLKRTPKYFVPPDADIVACLRLNMSCREIAERLGGNADTIGKHVRWKRLRDLVEKPAAVVHVIPVGPQPSPVKFINHFGISVPRVPTIHGHYEARL